MSYCTNVPYDYTHGGGLQLGPMDGVRGFTYTGNILERTLDALSLRHRVTADNVANVNTPGFKPSEVSFESALNAALQHDLESGTTYATEATQFPVEVTRNEFASMRADGNGVDADREMVTVAKTAIAYQAVAQQWSSMYGRLRMAVREGRR